MGQEQSFTHASATHVRRQKAELTGDSARYRNSAPDFRSYEDNYKRHKVRRSVDSFQSDHSTESSGYRSGSSAFDRRSTSDRSTNSEYSRLSIYKNDHCITINKELYKPVKIPKEKRYKLLDIDKCDANNNNTKPNTYVSQSEIAKLRSNNTNQTKKAGIRNYTPKILTEAEEKNPKNWL